MKHNETFARGVSATNSSSSVAQSSYRRLKKAKSMFTPRSGLSTTIFNHTPRRKDAYDRNRQSCSRSTSETPISSTPEQLLPTGSSVPLGYRRPSDVHEQDRAIIAARDEYIRQLESQRLRNQPTGSSVESRWRPQKPLLRTVRSTSSTSFGPSISSNNGAAKAKGTGFGFKARQISTNVKDRVKRVFQRTPSWGRSVPAQQVDAQRSHFRLSDSTEDQDRSDNCIVAPDGELIARVNSRKASLHRLPVHVDEGSRHGSIRSMKSMDSAMAKSRVTSWTNSTITENTRRLQSEDLPRLSVIQEHGSPHKPSSSAGRVGTGRRKGYALFRRPLKIGTGRVNAPIDSQMIYSALQQRFGANGNNRDYEEGNNESRPFTRNISESEESSRNFSGNTGTSGDTTIHRTCNQSTEPIREPEFNENLGPAGLVNVPAEGVEDAFEPPSRNRIRHKRSNATVNQGLTLAYLTDHNERMESSSTKTNEMDSAFLSPHRRIRSKRRSPYKRVMLTSLNEGLPNGEYDDESDHTQEKENRTLPGNPYDRGLCSPASESVYSRLTGGSPVRPEHPKTSADQNNAQNTAKNRGSPVAFRPPSSLVTASTSPNDDIQDWAITRATAVQKLRSDAVKFHENINMRRGRHIREKAVIYDDNADTFEGAVELPRVPVQLMSNNQGSPSSDVDGHEPARQRLGRLPLHEREPSLSTNLPGKASMVPSSQSPSTQHISNVENRRFVSSSTQNASDAPPLSQKASMTTMRSESSFGNIRPKFSVDAIHSGFSPGCGSVQNSTGGQSRHSPERTARLRRMQSQRMFGTKDRFGAAPRSTLKEEDGEDQVPRDAESPYDTAGTGLIDSGSGNNAARSRASMVEAFLLSRRMQQSGPVFI